MTVSAVTSVTFSLNELIREALDNIGVGSEGESVSADMYRRAKNSAALMIMSWNAMENLWRKEQVTLTPLAGIGAYQISPKPLRVSSARRKQLLGGYETPMTQWSRQEYLDMPNKLTSPSTPVNFYYDPQRDTGTLYLWPAPSAAVTPQIAIVADILRPMFVMNASADTLDMPAEWQETFVMNLAKRLMMKYPVNDASVGSLVIDAADRLFLALKAWDNEPSSIYLQADDRWDGWH